MKNTSQTICFVCFWIVYSTHQKVRIQNTARKNQTAEWDFVCA